MDVSFLYCTSSSTISISGKSAIVAKNAEKQQKKLLTSKISNFYLNRSNLAIYYYWYLYLTCTINGLNLNDAQRRNFWACTTCFITQHSSFRLKTFFRAITSGVNLLRHSRNWILSNEPHGINIFKHYQNCHANLFQNEYIYSNIAKRGDIQLILRPYQH